MGRWCSVTLCILLAAGAAGQAVEEAAAEVKGAEQGERGELSGKVVDSAGAPVAGAQVAAYTYRYESYDVPAMVFETVGEATTLPDGSFAFSVPAVRPSKTMLFVARKPGLAVGAVNNLSSAARGMRIVLGKPAVLEGAVVNEGGAPVAGAEVRLRLSLSPEGNRWQQLTGASPVDGLTAKTDEKGSFRFSDVPEGSRAEFVVEAPGRARVFTGVATPSRQGGQFAAGQADIRIVLPPEAKIEGVALDGTTGKPLPGTRVLVMPRGAFYPFFNRTCIAGPDGGFQVGGLGAGQYTVLLAHKVRETPEWVAPPVSVAVQAGRTTAGVTFEVRRGAVLEVLVQDEDGEPLPRASVRLSRAGAAPNAIGFSTDKEGVARLRLAPGSYTLGYVSHRGHARLNLNRSLSLEEGKTERVEVTLGGMPHAVGVALDAQGRPVEGAAVRVVPYSWADVFTDAGGRFDVEYGTQSFGEQAPAPILLIRHEKRNLVALVDLGEETKMLQVKLGPGLRLTGQVSGPDGNPVAKAQVLAFIYRGATGISIAVGTAGDDGRYEIAGLPPGQRYRVHARAGGYVRSEGLVPITPTETGAVEASRIVLEAATLSISGQVVDVDGRPVAGVRVSAGGAEQSEDQNVETDKDGKFTIHKLCKGPVLLEARYQEGWGRALAPAGATDVRIVLGRRADRP